MRLRYYGIRIFAIMVFTVLFAACKDEWDNHYNAKALNKSDLNLVEFIHSRNDLRTFEKMLKIAGYDSILSKSNTYTVWAPNDTALSTVNLNDTALVKTIVNNHITRFSCSTFGVSTKARTVLMMNNKLLQFARTGASYTFDGQQVVVSDLATANGIIHIVSKYAAYKNNIWEFISKTDGLDSLRAYINSLSMPVLDVTRSFQDGVFVDSIFKSSNIVFENLASLKTEDSTYTAILPDNTAWVEAYNRIMPYYKTLTKDGGVSSQTANAKWTLIKDLFFYGKKTLPLLSDTLQSTSGSNFIHPNRLFPNTPPTVMSNGLSYVTSQLKNTATESWHNDIKLEAEWSFYGRKPSNYSENSVSSIGTGYKASNGYYLSLVDISTSSVSKPFVMFPIPNTLSAKYNVYCVFVPAKIVDPNDMRPSKVRFYMSYVKSTGAGIGAQVTNANIDQNHNLLTTTSASSGGIFTTDATKVDTMLVVQNFELPYRNVMATNYADLVKSVTVALKVEIATGKTANELASYNRNLRIDYIILKPVQ